MLNIRLLIVAFIAMLLLPLSTGAAPISRTVGDRFEITVQYIQEPAILGDTNGIRLKLTENGEPVSGAISELTVQVEFMEAVRVLNMVEDSTQPGVYTGVFIPMQPGDYSFVLTGTIDGVEVNERFSVTDGLVTVTPRTDYEFPNAANGFGIENLTLPIAASAIIGLFVIRNIRKTN
jgi:2-keto-4-pentenoate hydratase/2-oxohepta-3-ene-1,7-dioic acid hydratase in catechol pathway